MHTVLLTGATGFVGSHVLDALARHGDMFRVVCSVRTEQQGLQLQQRYADVRVGFVVIDDLANKHAVDMLFKQNPTITHVIHLAAPWSRASRTATAASIDYERDVIRPSTLAAENLVGAIGRHGKNVQTLVVGSCFASMQNDPPRFHDTSKVYTARDMNFITREEACRNQKSATQGAVVFTEDAIWEVYYENCCSFTVLVMAMPLVLGPVLDPTHIANASFDGIVRDYLFDAGEVCVSEDDFASERQQRLPDLALPFYVDVRDAAVALIRPLMLPICPISRWFIAAGNIAGQQVVDIAYENIEELRPRLMIGRPGSGDEEVSQQCRFDDSESALLLAVDYRPLKETVVDMYRSLLKLNCI